MSDIKSNAKEIALIDNIQTAQAKTFRLAKDGYIPENSIDAVSASAVGTLVAGYARDNHRPR